MLRHLAKAVGSAQVCKGQRTKGRLCPLRVLKGPWCWFLSYLQEVLAGDDESQLGTEVFGLSLAPSHTLYKLRDVISHRLQRARKQELSMCREGQLAKGKGNDPRR